MLKIQRMVPIILPKTNHWKTTTMPVQINFYFDFGSPNAYLSHLVIPAIEARTGISFAYVPILLGGIFKATNNVSPAVSLEGIKNKQEYRTLETERFIKTHHINHYQFNPHFPVNTLLLMRGAIVSKQEGFFETYVNEIYKHMWAEPKKMDDPAVIQAALEESGLPVDTLMEGIGQPAVKQQLIKNTEEAVNQGLFGSPSFLVGNELYFGKDRLRDVEEEIERQKQV